ncbi:MAG: amidohydrolase family protein [Burkholderiales bacterium]
MHCDETDDPSSRHIETLARARRIAWASGTGQRVSTAVHALDGQLLRLEAHPADGRVGRERGEELLINITIQGRHDTYPKRRGMTRVPELMAAGITVAMGHDCVMDPWYSLGSGDMLEVASMGLHVAQMTGQDGMRACFDAVTVNAAKILHLDGYGIAPGNRADFVLLQARDPVEAIRLRATRLAVFRAGRLVAETPPSTASLRVEGRPSHVDWTLR